ncbi:MAG: inorganic diphosphatase [Firmicutes bacterium]|nr:inorganic diphosphatase [Bacillota bacterium]
MGAQAINEMSPEPQDHYKFGRTSDVLHLDCVPSLSMHYLVNDRLLLETRGNDNDPLDIVANDTTVIYPEVQVAIHMPRALMTKDALYGSDGAIIAVVDGDPGYTHLKQTDNLRSAWFRDIRQGFAEDKTFQRLNTSLSNDQDLDIVQNIIAQFQARFQNRFAQGGKSRV